MLAVLHHALWKTFVEETRQRTTLGYKLSQRDRRHFYFPAPNRAAQLSLKIISASLLQKIRWSDLP